MGQFGTKSSLIHDSTNHLYILRQPNGVQQQFHDFGQAEFPPGSFARQIEPGGFPTSVESYTAAGLIAEIHRSGTVGGQTLTEAFVYTYTEDDQIETLTLRRQREGEGWEDVRRAAYSYWNGTNTFGSAGDLQQVTIQTPTESGWADSETTVYRYYTAGQGNGFVHGLKFVINPATYQRMVNESVDPLIASDGVVAIYADNYYEFDNIRRVVLERTSGGAQTFKFDYFLNPEMLNESPNNWVMLTTETLPDRNKNIVYTNRLGQPLVKEFQSDSGSWINGY